MKTKYYFENGYLGYNEQLDQDEYSYADYEYELTRDDERDYIIHELRENQGFDKETAKKIYENVIDNYELTEQFLESCDKDEMADYFRDVARDEYEESRY